MSSTGAQFGTQHSAIAGGFERLLTLWENTRLLSAARLATLALTGLAVICGAAALIGAVPTRIYGHDIFIYLGNGWRVLNGQRPHVDFTSPWGPIGFLISALGLALAHHSVVGIGWGGAIAALIIGVWAFSLGKRFLAPAPRMILSWFLAALTVSPYPLGLSPLSSSSAMIYNRYGYALLGLVLLESYRVGRPPLRKRDDLLAGISTGAVLSLSFFLKASYFFVGAAIVIILGFLLAGFTRQRIVGIAVGLTAISTCVLAYLRFNIAAMVRDLRMAAGAREATMPSPKGIVLGHWPVLFGAVLFCGAAAFLLGDRARHWRGFRLPALAAIFFFADVNLIRSNAQTDGFIVCAILALLLINEIAEDQRRLPVMEARAHRPAYAAVLALGALLFVPQFASDLLGLAYGGWAKTRPDNAGVLRFTSPNLQPLVLHESSDNPPSEGRAFTTYVNDGVALLQRETRPNDKVLTMDVTNPFPYAMERPTPRGGHAASTYNYNMTDKYRPSDDWYFGDADIVMLPKRPSQGDNHYFDFFRAYGPGLKQRYTLAAETNMWWMYRRKP